MAIKSTLIFSIALIAGAMFMEDNAFAGKASSKQVQSEPISQYVPNAKLVGKGMFSYYFWDVYTG